MSPFKEKVIQIVRMIPEGTVVSYGQVALFAGMPRAARQVGWVLNSTEGKVDLPWWRVINNAGRISIKGTYFNTAELQKKLLQEEGVVVHEDLTLAIEKYRYLPTMEFIKSLSLDEEYISMLVRKYNL